MIRQLLVLMIGMAVVGCAVKRVGQVDPMTRETIGFAATARYPGYAQNRPDKVQAAAVVDRDKQEIQILNLSDNAIASPTVWVSGAYVRRVPTIQPRGSTVIKFEGLLQAGQTSMDFKRADQPVTKVEIQTADGLFAVQGPARPG